MISHDYKGDEFLTLHAKNGRRESGKNGRREISAHLIFAVNFQYFFLKIFFFKLCDFSGSTKGLYF